MSHFGSKPGLVVFWGDLLEGDFAENLPILLPLRGPRGFGEWSTFFCPNVRHTLMGRSLIVKGSG